MDYAKEHIKEEIRRLTPLQGIPEAKARVESFKKVLEAVMKVENLSLPSVNKRSELFICSFCKSDQTYLSEGGYVRTCLKCDKTGRVSE